MACGLGGTANRHATIAKPAPHSHAHSCAAATVEQPTQNSGAANAVHRKFLKRPAFSDDFTDSSTGWANGSYNGWEHRVWKGYYSLKLPQGATFCTAQRAKQRIRRGHLGGFGSVRRTQR